MLEKLDKDINGVAIDLKAGKKKKKLYYKEAKEIVA